MRTTILTTLIVTCVLALGCYHPRRHDPYPPSRVPDHRPDHRVGKGHGPPPHAPAHGHRAKVRGHKLTFDSHRGVYVVVGLPHIYWHSGWFFHLVRDRWLRSADGDGPWHDARWGDVPPRLRGHKGHGHGKAKGRKH